MHEITFTIPERRLCAELHFSTDVLRARRQYFLAQGQHWDYVKKRVLFNEIGAAILRGTKNAAVPDPRQKNAATGDSATKKAAPVALLLEKNPPPIAFTGALVVWSISPKNPRLVVCHLPGTDPTNPLNLVSLAVRESTNFLRGMQIPAKSGPGSQVIVNRVSDNHYELQGFCPRWRGRW